MTKLELITEARKEIAKIAKNTKIVKHDYVTTCYIGESGSFIVTKQHQRWSTRSKELHFPDNCTKKEVISELNNMQETEEHWEAMNE